MYWAVIHAVFGLLLAAPDTTASIVHTRPATGQQSAFSIKVRRLTCDDRDVQELVAEHCLALGSAAAVLHTCMLAATCSSASNLLLTFAVAFDLQHDDAKS
jgi:hypothetical protein